MHNDFFIFFLNIHNKLTPGTVEWGLSIFLVLAPEFGSCNL